MLEPDTEIELMGKQMDGKQCTIRSSAGYIAGMVNTWLQLCTMGYD